VGWFAAPEYFWSRLVFQRALAVIYVLAFLNAALQFRALLGSAGITPIPRFVARRRFREAPSVFYAYYSDRFFACFAIGGVALAAAAAAGLTDAVPLWAAMLVWALLWAGYLSIVNVGQIWYGFGWESLLTETGFLAIFLGNAQTAPPVLVIWLFRWLLFRVEFGAGLIKIRGDRCWRDLTCLDYHHETQPMPGPMSRFFHHRPPLVHRLEVASNHLTQLLVPFALFTPQPVATVAAAIVVVTQGWLVASGNFAWLNVLTMILAVPALDIPLFSGLAHPAGLDMPPWFFAVVLAASALTVALSYQPVRNMISPRQVMNTGFDPLRLVNSYGAFGHVTKTRYEVVIEGTGDPETGAGPTWREYEFKGKPGDPYRRPPQIAPYHLRLDWLMWFAALSPAMARGWFRPLLARLLAGDRDTLKLLRANPFPDQPPQRVRARLYRYAFATRAERRANGTWWRRELIGEYLPPVGRGQAETEPHG
jgi:hypothetical protein